MVLKSDRVPFFDRLSKKTDRLSRPDAIRPEVLAGQIFMGITGGRDNPSRMGHRKIYDGPFRLFNSWVIKRS